MDMGPFYRYASNHASIAVHPTKKVGEAKTLERLLEEYDEVFVDDGGRCKKEVTLLLKEGARRRFLKVRKIPYALKTPTEAEIEKQVKQGVLEPVETSDWATPIVVVPKAGNRALNGGELFTKLDLKNAYGQLPLDEASKKLCTLITHKGLFRVNRLPQGTASAPAIFQKFMDEILAGIEGVVVYFDDITVTGSNTAEHLRNLEAVLKRLKQYGLRLQKEKCEFLKKELVLLV
ncbi:hypothetical protein AAVH_12250 [Aphelenchoides avenae]|nr:hypothetical protein AAVH_12250 [Aphelenchus avenae]